MSLLFSQSLSGLIKALRNNKHNERAVVDTSLREISVEVKSTDWDIKAAAVLKLIYLEMLGYPAILTYSFNVLECMASAKYHIKSIGYLAAAQSFGASTEVILLANNLIKKDLQSSSDPSTIILTLTSLPALLVASPQLAEDILPDLLRMLTHSKPQVKRIATLTIGKIWCTSYPNASSLPTIEFSHIEKLRSGLTDGDPSVVSATVNVMLELARSRKDSLQSLLGLAPELFELLTNSTNNWMLIKVAKLFSLLTPIEPRLVRKLLPPLTNLISTTPAFSLLYECIQTVITGGMLNNSDATSTLAQSCIEKLSVFLSDKDQNLRYIALKGLSRLLQNAPHTTPLLARYYDDILTCIDEEDLTIRLKALELVERLTDRSNCKAIVVRLLEQIAPTSKSQGGRSATQSGLRSAAGALRAVSSAYDTSSPSGLASRGTSSSSPANASSFAISHYRYRLLLLILRLTSRPSDDGQQLYVNVVDFEWYVDTLFKCAYLSLSVLPTMNSPEAERLAHKLSDCLLDVTARAASVRHSSLTRCRRLLADQNFVALDNPVTVRVSSACAFILGEYGSPDTAGESTDVLVRSATFSPGNTGVCLGLLHCLARSLASMAENWEERHLATVDQVLKSICKTFEKLPCEEADLFTSIVEIVISGLAGPRETLGERGRSSEADTTTPDESAELATNPFASAQSAGMGQQQMPGESETATGPPKAMFLLQSLFAAYELRPLAPGAQALVSPPIHLDLDTPLTVDNVDLSSIADAHRPKQRLTRDSDGDVDEYGRPKVQTVSNSTSTSMAWTGIGDSDTPKKPKKSRKEGAVKGAKSRRKVVKSRKDIESDDVDSIPIVKLEMHDSEGKPGGDSVLPSSKQGERPSRIIRSQTSDTRTPSLPPIILNAGGEAPASRPVPTESTMSGSTAPGAEQFKLIQDVKEGGDASTAAQGAATVKVVKKKKRKKVKEGLLGNADV